MDVLTADVGTSHDEVRDIAIEELRGEGLDSVPRRISGECVDIVQPCYRSI